MGRSQLVEFRLATVIFYGFIFCDATAATVKREYAHVLQTRVAAPCVYVSTAIIIQKRFNIYAYLFGERDVFARKSNFAKNRKLSSRPRVIIVAVVYALINTLRDDYRKPRE